MQSRKIVIAVTMVLACSSLVTAQEPEYTRVASPFQEEFAFSVDTDLRPRVEVDGIRWVRFGVHTKEGKELVAGEEIPVTVELELNNQGPNAAKILIIALFEDAEGAPLDRVECSSVRVPAERTKESVQKFKLEGRVLRDARKVYLFCEVER